MEIIKVETYQALSEKAAEVVTKQILQKPNSVLGLATGSTPIGLYEHLIEQYKQGEISFQDVVTFNLDEYVGLDRNHDQSYYYFMQALQYM